MLSKKKKCLTKIKVIETFYKEIEIYRILKKKTTGIKQFLREN